MQTITDIDQLTQLQSSAAVPILFGGEHCAVCKSLRPQLESILEQQLPGMQAVYIDCEQAAEICAQHGVFSLPVVKAYIDGMKVAEESGAFSIKQLVQTIERPYVMWKESLL